MRHRTSIMHRPTGGGAARSRRVGTLHHGDTYQRAGEPPVPDGGRGEGVSGGKERVVGPLTLPLAGLICIDASCLIYSVEPTKHQLLTATTEEVQDTR